MIFHQISESSKIEAGHALRNKPFSSYQGEDGADLVGAASAIILGNEAPRLFGETMPARENDYIDGFSRPSRFLKDALSHYIEMRKQSSELVPSAGIGVKFVVNDVLQRVSATRIHAAAKESAFESDLNEDQLSLARMSSKNSAFLKTLGNIGRGRYDLLTKNHAHEVMGALLATPNGNLGLKIAVAAISVDAALLRQKEIEKNLESRQEAGIFFKPISDSSISAVREFYDSGKSTGQPLVDGAIKLLQDSGHAPEIYSNDESMLIGMARLVEERAGSFAKSSGHLAAMAITESNIISDARYGRPDENSDAISKGEYHKINPDYESLREGIEARILLASNTPPLYTMKLAMQDEMESVTRNALNRERDESLGVGYRLLQAATGIAR